MRMFAKRFQNGWKLQPTQHTVAIPTDQTHDPKHFLWFLFSQNQSLTKLNKLISNNNKISTISFAAVTISRADAYPLLLSTAAVLGNLQTVSQLPPRIVLGYLAHVPMSLMLWFQKTRNASLTPLLPSNFQATSLATLARLPPFRKVKS
mmetsp:Transcript_13113/g.23756  ORF Transcript_13113/g.23756 Transcript_13113/m.23756 type:complete len:149 (+) Transcript_13113:503-949(+)